MSERDGKVMRMFGIALVLLISACHNTKPSVYDQALPDRHDTRALSRIGEEVKPQDKQAWASIEQLITARGALKSKTVGQAITRWKAQRDCLQLHAEGQASAKTDEDRDHEIDAFNDCIDNLGP